MTASQDERQAVLLFRASENRVSFRLQPDVAFGNFQSALQRVLDFTALGLQSIPTSDDLPELETFPVRHFGSRLSLESLQAEYPSWIMGHALTDIIESLEPLIADLIKICRLALLISEANTIDKDRVKRALEDDFERETLGAKLGRLAREAPGVLTEDLKLALKALNKLRVCLTHAGGKVRESDCNPDNALELSCIFWEYFVEYADGTREPLHLGMVAKDEGRIVMCRSRDPRVFRVGERIQLTKQDLLRIAASIFEMVLALRSNFYAHVRNTTGREDFREQQVRWNFRVIFGEYEQQEPSK